MIPYDSFELQSINAIDPNSYGRILLPYVHYRTLRAIHLTERFVLVMSEGIFDTESKALVASCTNSGPRFYPAARASYNLIENLIAPYRLRLLSGVWIIEGHGRQVLHRDGV